MLSSTPPRLSLPCARPLVIALAAIGLAASATAKPCGPNVPKEGTCQDNQVVWCEDNEVNTLPCGNGTKCAWNENIKGFDCLAPECGETVPASGHCNASGDVEYCNEGKIKRLECHEGTECGWNAAIEAFDCLQSKAWADKDDIEGTEREEAPETPPEDDTDQTAEPTGVGSAGEGAPPIKTEPDLPTVSEPAPDTGASTDGGCVTGRGGPESAPLSTLLLLALSLAALTTRQWSTRRSQGRR